MSVQSMEDLFTRRYALAWWTWGLTLLLATLAWLGLLYLEQRNFERHFELRSREVVDAVQARMRRQEQVLLGGAGLFDASAGGVDRAAWRAYVQRLRLAENFLGVQGVGYSRLVSAPELAAHEAAVRAEGFADYRVHPSGARAQYSPIVYLEPFAGRNLAAFGYDLLFEATRAQALRRAGETGATSLSGKVTLVQEVRGREQAGFVIYVPVYDLRQPLATPQQRWQALRGFVFSPFRVGDLMRGILGQRDTEVDFQLFDGAEAAPDALMYDSQAERAEFAGSAPPMVSQMRRVQVLGRSWTLRFDSRAELEAAQHTPLPWVVLLLGMLVGTLLFVVLAALISRRAQAEQLALAMTAEIRQGEALLRRSEARLREAQHTAQLGSWEFDSASRAMVWSEGMYRLLGLAPPAEATRENWLGAVHPKDRAALRQTYERAVQARRPWEAKYRCLLPDGGVRWLHQRSFFELGEAGRPLRAHGTLQDITQLTEAQRVAEESIDYLQLVMNHVADGILTVDGDARVRSFNPAAEKIFGHAAAAVLGQPVERLLAAAAEAAPPHAFDAPGEREAQGRRADGSVFPMEVVVSASDYLGQPLFIWVVRDVTERRRVDRMKSEFVSTVSHELRTPLTSIRGALGLLTGGATGAVSEQAAGLLKIASNNTERLLLLINDILDMEKIQSGQMAFRFQSFELLPFLHQALADTAAYGAQFGVRFELTPLAPELEALRVYADRDRLAQVMANLLSNAAKFSPRDAAVTVAVTLADRQLRLSVRDRGPGIALDFQPRMFERFSQSDASDARSKGGTGLGLAITKAIVDKHGGHIGFDTAPGQGTTFHIDLPRIGGDAAPAPAPAVEAPVPDRPRALVVEDDPDVAALVQRMLQDAGYAIDLAHDAAQTRALLARQPQRYKFITLDLMLPGEDGLSLLRSLRADAATQDLPVVVLSAKAEQGRLEANGGAVGVLDWLVKPIDPRRLLAVVRRAAGAEPLPRVLHVEDDPDVRQVVAAMLRGQCELAFAETLQQGRERLLCESFNLVLLDIGLPDGSGLDLLDLVEQRVVPPQVVIFSAQDMPREQLGRVGAVLQKSRTSNAELLDILLAAVRHAEDRNTAGDGASKESR